MGEFFGWLLMIGAIVGVYLYFRKLNLSQELRGERESIHWKRFGPSHDPQQPVYSTPRTAESVVREKSAGDILEIEGRTEQVIATATWLELKFYGTDKADKVHVSPSGDRLREFKAFMLSGRQLLVQHPLAEGSELGYFLYERRDLPRAFAESIKDEAGAFARSNQTADISIEAFGKDWQLQDIMWLDVQPGRGEFFVQSSRGKLARMAMLLAKNGDEWLLFADLRSGEGSDSVWVGQHIDIDVAVEV